MTHPLHVDFLRETGRCGIGTERALYPNRWFNNLEPVADSSVDEGSLDDVGSVHKYYAAYKLALED